MGIKDNIEKFRQEVKPYGAKLIAVSKTHPAEKIREAYEAGQRIFGENRVQEMTDKQPNLPQDIVWHLIGHLQRNKVKYVAPFVSLIHSVDSLNLLEEINKQGQKADRIIPCLLQVFIAREETKFGLDREELLQVIQSPETASFRYVMIEGLMAMATFTPDEKQIREEFRSLRKTFEQIKQQPLAPNISMQELSMGMSSDYKIALEEGSTMVRVGTGIFGERSKA